MRSRILVWWTMAKLYALVVVWATWNAINAVVRWSQEYRAKVCRSPLYPAIRFIILIVLSAVVVYLAWGALSRAVPKVSDRVNIAVALSTFTLAIVTVWTNMNLKDESRKARELHAFVALDPEIASPQSTEGDWRVRLDFRYLTLEDMKKPSDVSLCYINISNIGNGTAFNVSMGESVPQAFMWKNPAVNIAPGMTKILQLEADNPPERSTVTLRSRTAFGNLAELTMKLKFTKGDYDEGIRDRWEIVEHSSTTL